MERYSAFSMTALATQTLKLVETFDSALRLDPAPKSYIYNGWFQVWHRGDSVSVPALHDRYIAGGWIVTTHSNGPAVVASKNDEWLGGCKLEMNYTAAAQWVYLRQLVPNLPGLLGQRLTLVADVTSDGPVEVDAYVNARYGTPDEDREVCVDSGEQTLSDGRRYVAVTFDIPTLSTVASAAWTDHSCLELALRFKSTAPGKRTVIVHSMTLAQGSTVMGPEYRTLAEEWNTINQFFETGFVLNAGMNTASGQKRATANYKVKKSKLVTVDEITVTDLKGAVDRISIYDQYGNRTDNVPYTVIQGDGTPGDGFRNGFTVVKNNTTAAGMAFLWTVERW